MSPFSLLSEYTDTLETLPPSLSSHFADLRELDAVLTASTASLTAKLTALTEMIEHGTGKHEQRLWLLMDIADEATRLRLGGEDKIRVACQAADTLRSHVGHLRALADNIPDLDRRMLEKNTTYPHVGDLRSVMPPLAMETGRRRRTGFASALRVSGTAVDATPVKRKRNAARAEEDGASPRKLVDTRPRAGGRKRIDRERPPSPTESLPSALPHSRPGPVSRRTSSRATRPASEHVPPVYFDPPGPGAFGLPLPSTHPSLTYAHPPNGHGHGHAPHATPFDLRHTTNPTTAEWLPSTGHAFRADDDNDGVINDNNNHEDADMDAEADTKPYCICRTPSAGDMIACDGEGCPYEWFHLTCLGLDCAPEGTWVCDDCRAKQSRRAGGRGGRRRANANGGNAGGRSRRAAD